MDLELIVTWIGLCIGNLLYQYMHHNDYNKAFDVCWFQSVALFAYWLCHKIWTWISVGPDLKG